MIVGGIAKSDDCAILMQFHIILENPHHTPALMPPITTTMKSGNSGMVYESITLTTLINDPRCFSLFLLLQMRTISKMIPNSAKAIREYLMTSAFTFISVGLVLSTQILIQSNTIREYTMKESNAMHRSRNKYPTITGTKSTRITKKRPITARQRHANSTSGRVSLRAYAIFYTKLRLSALY